MQRFLAAAGASVEDVIRGEVTLAKSEYRELLNVEWLKHFNGEESLPVRKAVFTSLPEPYIAQLELMAVTSD